ncbi:hypothetical protein ACFPK9_07185 [Rubritalea spongiae]|uniref:Uncharacterized protein n=1 Tax=Rubritalea spongiae TaxID=430797 RepID=A0ABW5E1E6_9BACT
MSEQDPFKKVVHRLEPKKRPVVSTSIDDAEKLEELSQVAPSVNTQFFGDGPQYVEDVETDWDGVEIEKSEGRKWLIISVCAFSFFFVGCMLWGFFLSKNPQSEESAGMKSEEVVVELSYEEKSASRKEAVERYLSASSVDEKAQYVRDAERVKPLMEEYYREHPLQAETLSEDYLEEPMMGKDQVLWRVRTREAKAGQAPYLILETSDAGESLVDWEADVVHQPSDWERFIAVRSTQPHTFRVFLQVAQLSGFHGYEFADYTKYRCFKVTIPGRDDYLWAYSEVGSKLDAKMLYMVTAGGRRNIHSAKKVHAILQLRFPENSQSDMCVAIEDLVQAGWLR